MTLKEIEQKLQDLRKELWHELHDRQEWSKKDTIIGLIDKAIDEINSIN